MLTFRDEEGKLTDQGLWMLERIFDRDIHEWECIDCKKDTMIEIADYYMVTDELWNKFGCFFDKLCLSCFEKRMGRKIEKTDLTPVLVNSYNGMIADEDYGTEHPRMDN